jgi:hypothetical protein
MSIVSKQSQSNITFKLTFHSNEFRVEIRGLRWILLKEKSNEKISCAFKGNAETHMIYTYLQIEGLCKRKRK